MTPQHICSALSPVRAKGVGVIPCSDAHTVSPALLRSLLDYDASTGRFTWLVRPASMFSTERACAAWNGKNANREAFTTVGTSGYREGRIFGKLYRAHRVAFAIVNDGWPEHEVDHINGDRLDNRAANLRAATRVENGRNQKRPRDSRSGSIGVTWFARDGKWQAHISTGGKKSHLGYFADKSDAIAARQAAERNLGFHQNHGRPQ